MSSTSPAIIVGLGGVTNGGKTTMCKSLEHLLSSTKSNFRVKSMHLDNYFRPNDDPHHIHLDEFNHHDWDCLEAIDTEKFVHDIELNRYQCDLLLIEGFLIFNISNAKELYDLIYYFDLPYEECHRRRSSRNYDPPDPKNYFEKHVWQVHLKTKQEVLEYFNKKKLVIVNTKEESFDKIQERIVNDIETILKEKQIQ
ncbi:unnamed protein product [Adineta steineri]|uniref:Uncharacterized protein n=1 Tax=Adineta steineri TaxID=433720 RepID=A0A815KJL9_9BILA|nr:unnamed protein product [Adineta steineri]CAF3978934.1 unnamed protein product [Adineta steineri]